MRDKVLRILSAWKSSSGLTVYENLSGGSARAVHERNTRKEELQNTLNDHQRASLASEKFVLDLVQSLTRIVPQTGNRLLEDHRLFCLKEKSMYAALNLFEGVGALLRCDVWFPTVEEDAIRRLLVGGSVGEASAMLVADRTLNDAIDARYHNPRRRANLARNNRAAALILAKGDFTVPPSFFRSNELTAPFAEMVCTYGAPRYQEISPVVFSVITFPFIFGVMFGDIGHGFLLFSFGIYLCFWADQKNLKREQPALHLAKYMLLLMGFFALYAGFMYGDFFSMGCNLFGSRWQSGGRSSASGPASAGAGQPAGGRAAGVPSMPDYDVRNSGLSSFARGEHSDPGTTPVTAFSGPYPFGIDPAWHGASNELLFMNSLKMKIAVLFGVAQMLLGLLLRGLNAYHENSRVDFVCEFVPMLVFLLAFFGYMDYMIL